MKIQGNIARLQALKPVVFLLLLDINRKCEQKESRKTVREKQWRSKLGFEETRKAKDEKSWNTPSS